MRIPADVTIPVIRRGGPLSSDKRNQNETRKTQWISPNLRNGAHIPRMRLLSSPNSANELLESANLGAAESFPELIFGFLPSVIRGIVKPRKSKLFDDLSSREFQACGSPL
jgi:hypothetical protein